MQLPDFKCRASAGGALMTNPRNKNAILSSTMITHIESWIKQQIYQQPSKQISSKYLSKGVMMEDEAIDYAANHFGWLFAQKNEEWFQNEYFTGTPDVFVDGEIIDIKNSWDHNTFPLFNDAIPTPGYEYQLQIYMDMTGYEKARLVYCLMDAPESLIMSEARKIAFAENGDGEVTKDLYESTKEKLTYSHLSSDLRIKDYEVKYDPLIVAQLKTKVAECRQYIEKHYSPIIKKLNR